MARGVVTKNGSHCKDQLAYTYRLASLNLDPLIKADPYNKHSHRLFPS